MKHVHYDKVAANDENMNFIFFVRWKDWEWKERQCDDDQLNFSCGNEYFLCLTKHNKDGQCLHWLNGGDVQVRYPEKSWVDLDKYDDDTIWPHDSEFMLDGCEIRIKPKKEKRWIVFSIGSEGVVAIFYNPQIAKDYVGSDSGYQVIEIEVEV